MVCLTLRNRIRWTVARSTGQTESTASARFSSASVQKTSKVVSSEREDVLSIMLRPELVRDALIGVFREEIACEMHGNAMWVDTPYILQDGSLLQAVLEYDPLTGKIIVSDNAYAAAQAELYTRTPSALRHRFSEFRKIADELELDWDTDFRFQASSVDEAVRRIATLARAVDRGIAHIHARTAGSGTQLRDKLAESFRLRGLTVDTERIRLGQDLPLVSVDLQLRSEISRMAVEILSGATTSGASGSINRAAMEFNILARHGYPGKMAAVYDKDSAVAVGPHLARFKAASPDSIILPSDEAVPELFKILHAA